MKLAVTLLLALCLPGSSGSEATEVDFATLSGFDYVEGMKLPDDVVALDEQEIEISGFMQREDGGDGPVEFFMLIDDACGCQGTPKLNEILFCAMPEGETTEILAGTVTVTGKLYVGEEKDDGVVVTLYSLDADSVTK